MFHIISTMLKLLQPICFSGGLVHKDPQENIRNHVDVCCLFSFSNSSQESVRLRLFHFSLMGQSCKCLVSCQ